MSGQWEASIQSHATFLANRNRGAASTKFIFWTLVSFPVISPLILDQIKIRYDREFLRGHFSDRTFSNLLFCQTLIFVNVLLELLFCQKIAKIVLSKFGEILSNAGGYIDSGLFCQTLQSCLTEQFQCLTEFLLRARFVWQNIPKMFQKQFFELIS